MGQYGSASHPGREVSNSKDSDLVKAMKAGISSLLLAGGNWYRVWLIGGSWGGWASRESWLWTQGLCMDLNA